MPLTTLMTKVGKLLYIFCSFSRTAARSFVLPFTFTWRLPNCACVCVCVHELVFVHIQSIISTAAPVYWNANALLVCLFGSAQHWHSTKQLKHFHFHFPRWIEHVWTFFWRAKTKRTRKLHSWAVSLFYCWTKNKNIAPIARREKERKRTKEKRKCLIWHCPKWSLALGVWVCDKRNIKVKEWKESNKWLVCSRKKN